MGIIYQLASIIKVRLRALSCFSCVQLYDCSLVGYSPWGFSTQEHWSGLPCPPPGDLPDSGIEPESLRSPALTGRFFTTSTTWEAQIIKVYQIIKANALTCQAPLTQVLCYTVLA